MITIETSATVTQTGELTIHVNVPAEIQPGEHPVVLVIAENTRAGATQAEFVVHPAGLVMASDDLRRESLYGDDGR
jgi:hypothetical protein